MNAEQKQRAKDLIVAWKSAVYTLHANRMVALLQELIDAPGPQPVLVVEVEPDYWHRGHYCEGTKSYIDPTKVWGLPVGTKLYTAPPAPSVPDEQLQAAFDRGLKAGNEQGIAQQVEIHKLHKILAAATTPAEAPADVARDAERYRACNGSNCGCTDGTALYAAPQPQKLSDERILELIRKTDSGRRPWGIGSTEEDAVEFARAIERELLGE